MSAESNDPSAASTAAAVSTAAAAVPALNEDHTHTDFPSAAVLSDPFQPVLLLLPKSRSLEQQAAGGTAGGGGRKQKISPLIGLFGPHVRAEILHKIKIKWYVDDAHLMRIVCGLHLMSASCTSNISGVPPCFIGVMYDSHLNTEAATLAAIMARMTEAISAINNTDQPFAKCQVKHTPLHRYS